MSWLARVGFDCRRVLAAVEAAPATLVLAALAASTAAPRSADEAGYGSQASETERRETYGLFHVDVRAVSVGVRSQSREPFADKSGAVPTKRGESCRRQIVHKRGFALDEIL